MFKMKKISNKNYKSEGSFCIAGIKQGELPYKQQYQYFSRC